MTPEEKRKYFEELSLFDFKSQLAVVDYASSELNKIIFYLGTGTFVLSISFIGYLKTKILHPYVLIASWVCFIIVIVGQIINHRLSKKVANRKIDLINKSRVSGFTILWQNETNKDPDIIKWIGYASKIEKIVIFFLAIGLILLLSFGAINLLARNTFQNWFS